MSTDERFSKFAAAIGFPLDQPIKIGGNYKAMLQVDHTLYVSRQLPQKDDATFIPFCIPRVNTNLGGLSNREKSQCREET